LFYSFWKHKTVKIEKERESNIFVNVVYGVDRVGAKSAKARTWKLCLAEN
jgi:hypothetical protein